MTTETKLLEIENKLERMHGTLQRQETELETWRDRSVRVPNWIRNSGIALFLAIFGQTMTAVWWASEITNTQANILADVKVNTEYRMQSAERYNDIMIEITKLQVMMESLINDKD
ncbi:hypothetical protein [uncultured Mediterranean phage]|nr:hypothetical protein [uncultured Mediterranean phage]